MAALMSLDGGPVRSTPTRTTADLKTLISFGPKISKDEPDRLSGDVNRSGAGCG